MRADQRALQQRALLDRDVLGRERAEAGRDAVVRLDVAGEGVDRRPGRRDRGLRLGAEHDARAVAGDGDDVRLGERTDPDLDALHARQCAAWFYGQQPTDSTRLSSSPSLADPRCWRSSTCPTPTPGPGEVLVRVAATAINRADLLQRQGNYPPPKGASSTRAWSAPARSRRSARTSPAGTSATRCARCSPGGGYAELVAVPVGQLMHKPENLSLVDAAALPEVACTVWSMVFGAHAGRLQPGETLPRARRLERHRHHGHPARPPEGRPGARDGRHAPQARLLPRARRGRRHQLPRGRLRRARVRRDRRPRRRRPARQHGRELPAPQRRVARARRAADRPRPAGRTEGRARPGGGAREAGDHPRGRRCVPGRRRRRPRSSPRPRTPSGRWSSRAR